MIHVKAYVFQAGLRADIIGTITPKVADGRNAAVFDYDGQTAAAHTRQSCRNFQNSTDLALGVRKRMFGASPFVYRCTLCPTPLVNSGHVFTHHDDIDVAHILTFDAD